jgi:hypothetical protein
MDQLSEPCVINVAAKIACFNPLMPETGNEQKNRNGKHGDAIPPAIKDLSRCYSGVFGADGWGL